MQIDFSELYLGFLFQHPSMAIVKGAGMVMKAVIEVMWMKTILFMFTLIFLLKQ